MAKNITQEQKRLKENYTEDKKWLKWGLIYLKGNGAQ